MLVFVAKSYEQVLKFGYTKRGLRYEKSIAVCL